MDLMPETTEKHVRTFLEKLGSNPPHVWIEAGATLAVLLLVIWVMRTWVLGRLEKLTAKTPGKWDDVIVEVLQRIHVWLIFPALLYAATQAPQDPALELPGALIKGLRLAALIGVGVQLLISAQRIIDASLQAVLRRSRTQDGGPDPTLATSLGIIRVIIVGAIGIVVVLVTLDNLGFEVKSLLTGLGIGGIAIALAVQNILGDLFGSLTIVLDKPFVVGDSIQVGDKSGTVERIGIKTTRVRAQSGEELIFANSDLLTSRVQNFKRMRERRVSFVIALVYDIAPDKIAKAPGLIKAAVEKQPELRFDRSHLRSFGLNGLEIESVYFVRSADYMAYMDAQQAINLEILREFIAAGIEFAPNGQPFSRAKAG